MSNVVEYSSKSTALRGIARLGMTDKVAAEAHLTKLSNGKFAVDTAAVEQALGIKDVSEEDADLILACGHSHCPSCGVHLSNGLSDFDGMVDRFGSEALAYKNGQKTEWMCLACNHEFGDPITPKASKGSKAPTRHYTNKSTVDGAVSVCWNIYAEHPELRRKDAIAAAVEAGVAFYTARTQYQKWFKAKK